MRLLKDRMQEAFSRLPKEKQSKKDLADYCMVRPPSVQDWFTGATKSLRGESLVRAAEYLDVSESWLASGKGPIERGDRPALVFKSQDPRRAHIHLPVLEVRPSAGHGGEPVDYPAVIDYLEVPEDWAMHRLGRDLSRYRVLPVSGDSMSPTINDGDLVFVDTNVTSYQANGIYVILWHERLLVKRLRALLSSGKIEIASDNESSYPPETVTLSELSQLHICGLVKCWWSIKGV